jgi:hypothetical protein
MPVGMPPMLKLMGLFVEDIGRQWNHGEAKMTRKRSYLRSMPSSSYTGRNLFS